MRMPSRGAPRRARTAFLPLAALGLWLAATAGCGHAGAAGGGPPVLPKKYPPGGARPGASPGPPGQAAPAPGAHS